jgi:hypothetical protein
MTGLRRAARVGLILTATVVAGCTNAKPVTKVHHDQAVPALKLVAFDDCGELLSSLRTATRDAVGPYGLPGDERIFFNGRTATGAVPDSAVRAPGAGTTAAEKEAPNHSSTNTHEAGVDEPDLVKTDGKRIVTVSRGTLKVVDVAGRKVTGSVPLDQDTGEGNLLLAGDHALVLTTGVIRGGIAKGEIPPDGGAQLVGGSRLLLVDLSGAPKVLARYAFEGSLVDARQVGSVARVVLKSVPRIEFPMAGGPQPVDEDAMTAGNRKVVDQAPVDRWLPRYTVESGGKKTDGNVDCRSISRPTEYSGTSMLSVLTFDLSKSTLDNGNPVSLVADGQTVYANGSSLYVATDQRWRAWPMPTWRGAPRPAVPEQRTDIYKFDIAGTGKPKYVAGGKIPGWLINQYAMSEWQGGLRAATTTGQMWDANAKSESTVYVLDGSLKQVGQVGGLGKGERIYAVRFIGPTGYVVTFRQTDPLYVVDLREPASPKVTGELKINGYSAYLHPAGDGRLIGVGQDADSEGRRRGAQVSLFDVSDPAKPGRLANYDVPHGYTEAEFDPHAFLYWPATGLLVVPMSGADGSADALALKVTGSSIAQVGTVRAKGAESIRRSLMIGDALWTVSETTMAAHSAGTMSALAEIPLT